MTIIASVFKELFKMFVADFRLTMATLAAVAVTAILLGPLAMTPIYGGPLLLLLCIVIFLESVLREARIRAAGTK